MRFLAAGLSGSRTPHNQLCSLPREGAGGQPADGAGLGQPDGPPARSPGSPAVQALPELAPGLLSRLRTMPCAAPATPTGW